MSVDDAGERTRQLLSDVDVRFRVRVDITYTVKPLVTAADAVESRMRADIFDALKSLTGAARGHEDGHIYEIDIAPAECVLSDADAVRGIGLNPLADAEYITLLFDRHLDRHPEIVAPYVTKEGTLAVPMRLLELAALNEAAQRARASDIARGRTPARGEIKLVKPATQGVPAEDDAGNE